VIYLLKSGQEGRFYNSREIEVSHCNLFLFQNLVESARKLLLDELRYKVTIHAMTIEYTEYMFFYLSSVVLDGDEGILIGFDRFFR
jgi:hypothetical protein